MSQTSSADDMRRRAAEAGLDYVEDFEGGIQRRRRGNGFQYTLPTGRALKSTPIRQRIDDLVIPPAWTDVWICATSDGHIQAVGRDEDGRKQYIYHPAWEAITAAGKLDRMLNMPKILPRVRRRVRRDLRGRKLTQQRVLAAVVRVIDKAQLRVGNEQSVEQRDSRGATTLAPQHVEVDRFHVALDFPAKSGKRREVEFSDRKVARVIRQCTELDGEYLFSYIDEAGETRAVDSVDVNAYLRQVADEEITAKDFRTWWGSVVALDTLSHYDEADMSPNQRKRAVVAAVKAAAQVLGNTPAVCRRSYIYGSILDAFLSGDLPKWVAKFNKKSGLPRRELTLAERRLAAFLKATYAQAAKP